MRRNGRRNRCGVLLAGQRESSHRGPSVASGTMKARQETERGVQAASIRAREEFGAQPFLGKVPGQPSKCIHGKRAGGRLVGRSDADRHELRMATRSRQVNPPATGGRRPGSGASGPEHRYPSPRRYRGIHSGLAALGLKGESPRCGGPTGHGINPVPDRNRQTRPRSCAARPMRVRPRVVAEYGPTGTFRDRALIWNQPICPLTGEVDGVAGRCPGAHSDCSERGPKRPSGVVRFVGPMRPVGVRISLRTVCASRPCGPSPTRSWGTPS